jgi:NitT/TauT family transport system substrate-binding protein
VVAGGFALAAGLAAPNVATAAPLAIKVGWATMPGHLIPVLFDNPQQKGLKHAGSSYTVEPVLFRGSSPQITAMAAGELNLTAFSASADALAISNAGLDARVLADIIQDGVPGYHSDTWLVAVDGPVHALADLKGKRIATNAIGSAADTAMRATLETVGLHDRRDYVVVQASFQAMPALLREGKVDCAPILQPMQKQMLSTGKFRSLFEGSGVMGATQAVFLAGNGSFLDDNKAAVMDFMEDYVRARQWFMNPANRKESIGVIADFMKVPQSELGYLFTKDDYYRAPNGQPNVPGIQRPIDIAVKLGVLKQDVKIAPKHVDLRFVDEADKRIGKPPTGEASE